MTMRLANLAFEYDNTLVGKTRVVDTSFFRGSEQQNQEVALQIVQYVVEKYLKWTPEEMQAYFNEDIVKLMKLESVMRFIVIPPELRGNTYFYIAHLVYPKRIRFEEDDLTIQMYSDILEGKRAKFVKDYMEGVRGQGRACICLRYAIENFMPDVCSLGELYAMFASPKIKNWLRQYKLFKICSDMFITPLDYLHSSLSNTQKSDVLYNVYRLDYLLNTLK